MPRGRKGEKLTVEAVREDPLRLVNAGEEELRDLFGQHLGEPEEVEEAVEFVGAWRDLFNAASTTPADHREEVRTVKFQIRRRWDRLAPWTRLSPQADALAEGQMFKGLVVEKSQRSAVWYCLEKESMDTWIRVMAGKHLVVWERLWGAYQELAKRVGRCVECGTFFTNRNLGPQRVYCSNACRMRAARQRKG